MLPIRRRGSALPLLQMPTEIGQEKRAGLSLPGIKEALLDARQGQPASYLSIQEGSMKYGKDNERNLS